MFGHPLETKAIAKKRLWSNDIKKYKSDYPFSSYFFLNIILTTYVQTLSDFSRFPQYFLFFYSNTSFSTTFNDFLYGFLLSRLA